MSMTHEQSLQALSESVSGLLDPQQRLALEEHLAGCVDCRQAAQRLAALDEQLRASLGSRWITSQPTSSQLASAMARIESHAHRTQMRERYATAASLLAWGAAVLLFIFLLSQSIRLLMPRPPDSGASPISPVTALPAILSPQATPQSTAQPATPYPTPPSSTQIASPKGQELPRSSLFPDLRFILQEALPDSPASIMIYTQRLGPALSIENALQKADQLGLQGNVYRPVLEDPEAEIYIVSEGNNRLQLINFPGQFDYIPDYANISTDAGDPMPFEELALIASKFLAERGLLQDLPYRVEPAAGERGVVRFVRLLNGYPVIYGIGYNSAQSDWIKVTVNSQGQVSRVRHGQLYPQPAGELPILSPLQAWQRLSQPDTPRGVRYVFGMPDAVPGWQTWQRQYPIDQTADLYGYAEMLPAVEQDQSPLVTLNNLRLVGDVQGLDPSLGFIHAWGQMRQDDAGSPYLELAGWEKSPIEEQYLSGTFRRQGNQTQLIVQPEAAAVASQPGTPDSPSGSGTSQIYTLIGVPDEVPDGVQVYARGAPLPGGVLEWFFLEMVNTQPSSSYGAYDSCYGGGGGGGGGGDGYPLTPAFGGGFFAPPSLSPAEGAPLTPTAVPIAFDQVIGGLEGMLYAETHLYADGVQELQVRFIITPTEQIPNYWEARLSGENITGIEQYYGLPIRLWGRTQEGADGGLSIQVERYQPVYPDVQVQSFIGVQSGATLEGQDVFLFTTRSGEQFVQESSLSSGQSNPLGEARQEVEIEGYLIPGYTFSGYPVLRDMAAETTPDGAVSMVKTGVIDHTHSSNSQLQSVVKGEALVERVELAYAAASVQNCKAEDGAASNGGAYLETPPWLFLQPVWVFSGHLQDGRYFEIQVQALPGEYLR